jgi:putative transposase
MAAAREGIVVPRSTVARLMCTEGLQDVVRGARVYTTVPDAAADRPRDLVERAFVASRPNQLWVTDFTYVATSRGDDVYRLRDRRVLTAHRRLAGE